VGGGDGVAGVDLSEHQSTKDFFIDRYFYELLRITDQSIPLSLENNNKVVNINHQFLDGLYLR